MGFLQTFGKSNAGKSFAYGNRVNPNGSGALSRQLREGWKRKTEPLAKIRKIFALAQALHEPVGYEQEGCKAHEKAINEIH
jgi:hypothetical protein